MSRMKEKRTSGRWERRVERWRTDSLGDQLSTSYREFKKFRDSTIHQHLETPLGNVVLRGAQMALRSIETSLGDTGQASQDGIQSRLGRPPSSRLIVFLGGLSSTLMVVLVVELKTIELLYLLLRGVVTGDKRNIVRPPGSFLRGIAEFFFSKKTLELVIAPVIADMQLEYCEAVAADRRLKASWIRLRGYWSLFKAVGLYSLLRTVSQMWRKVGSP